jgi:hypothetical protein
MKEMNIKHYVEKYKEHEAKRLSTNERNAYWREYNESNRVIRKES